MDQQTPPLGFTDLPPRPGGGRDNPKHEEKPYPPPDRPVYSIPKKDEDESAGGDGLKLAVMVVVGILAVAAILFAATWIYKPESAGLGKTPAVAVETVPSVSPDALLLRVELTRTIRILEGLAAEFADDAEKLAEIKEMENDARSILESMESNNK